MQARAGGPMGFAINPVIPNQPVAAEVDRPRQRELLRWLVVGAVLVAAALFDGWQRYGIVRAGRDLSDVQNERMSEEIQGRHLQLEVEAKRDPRRLEELADQMHLVRPRPSDAIVIERVVPPEQPPSSVVASR
jgi:hypothetical protein